MLLLDPQVFSGLRETDGVLPVNQLYGGVDGTTSGQGAAGLWASDGTSGGRRGCRAARRKEGGLGLQGGRWRTLSGCAALVGRLLESLRFFVETILLHNVEVGRTIRVMSLYHYVATDVCRDPEQALRGRLLMARCLVASGLPKQAHAQIHAIAAEHDLPRPLPQLDFKGKETQRKNTKEKTGTTKSKRGGGRCS